MTYHLAVLGSPIAHSLSPRLHQAAYAHLGWDAQYQAIDTNVDQLSSRITRLRESPDWRGYSLTMPLKHAVVPMLDQLGETARLTKVVNTVISTSDGLVGDNTDVTGIVRALQGAGFILPTQPESTTRALVLGAGATAESALVALSQIAVSSITLAARNLHKAELAVVPYRKLFTEINVTDLANLDSTAEYDAIVSTLPAHAADAITSKISRMHTRILLDVAYSPWPSQLALCFGDTGTAVISGFDMLVHQAVEQVRLFAPEVFPADQHGVAELTRAMFASANLD